MVEVEEDIDDYDRLIEGDLHVVPLAVHHEISAGKLGIVVTGKRMVGRSLDLNVSVSYEGVALKVLEGVAAVAGALVLVYSTACKIRCAAQRRAYLPLQTLSDRKGLSRRTRSKRSL